MAGWGSDRRWHRKPIGWDATRLRIARRDSYTCRRCGLIAPKGHCSHIVPQAKGGSDADHNLRWTCPPCNQYEAQAESRKARGVRERARIGPDGWPE